MDLVYRVARKLLVMALACGSLAYSSAAVADSWTEVAPLPAQRLAFGTATGNDGRIYVFGGTDFDFDHDTLGVFAYSPAANVWSSVAPLPSEQYGLAGASDAKGRVYAIGGREFNATPNFLLSRVLRYQPATDRWSPVSPLAQARDSLAAATGTDGRIYAIGGRSASGIVGTVERFNPTTGNWKAVAPMPTPRDGLMAATAPDGRIFAIGGCNNSADVALATVEAYDPATDTWMQRRPLPAPRCVGQAVTGPDGRIYAIGGVGRNGNSHSSVLAYDPTANTWTKVAPTIYPHTEAGAALAGGHIYVYGGGGNINGVTPGFVKTERYDP
jgi:N-acetylneuraminic acid mutarotase